MGGRKMAQLADYTRPMAKPIQGASFQILQDEIGQRLLGAT
jgi:hypothetical protein